MPRRENVSGAARGRAKVIHGRGTGQPTPRQARLAAGSPLGQNQVPDREREICSVCGKPVLVRADGTLRGHQARPGISCAGAVPRTC